MNLDKLRRLIRLVEGSDIDELEVSWWWQKVRIVRRSTELTPPPPRFHEVTETHGPPVVTSDVLPEEPALIEQDGLHPIRSPIVGTFYRAPSPEIPPYVQEGDSVEVGQVVGIIEAMKIMNEIESDVRGQIVQILIENAHPVEYNQALFMVKVS